MPCCVSLEARRLSNILHVCTCQWQPTWNSNHVQLGQRVGDLKVVVVEIKTAFSTVQREFTAVSHPGSGEAADWHPVLGHRLESSTAIMRRSCSWKTSNRMARGLKTYREEVELANDKGQKICAHLHTRHESKAPLSVRQCLHRGLRHVGEGCKVAVNHEGELKYSFGGRLEVTM